MTVATWMAIRIFWAYIAIKLAASVEKVLRPISFIVAVVESLLGVL